MVSANSMPVESSLDTTATTSANLPMSSINSAIVEPRSGTAPAIHHAIRGDVLWDATDIDVMAHIPGLVYAGALNGLVGPPKGGKTTFAVAQALSYLEGKPAGPILWVTEQSDRSFKAQLKRMPERMGERLMKAKLPGDRQAFYVMTPTQHYSSLRVPVNFKIETDWDRNLRLWMDDIKALDPAILVIDTFNRYAELKEGGENDGPMILSRLGDLNRLLTVKSSLGVLAISHSRKAVPRKQKFLRLTDIRGSSAYAGGLDHVVLLNRQPKERTCYISVESRLADNEQFTMTMQPDGTYLRGDEDGFGGQASKIRSVVDANEGRASREMVGSILGLTGDALRKALKRAAEAGAVTLEGDDVLLQPS